MRQLWLKITDEHVQITFAQNYITLRVSNDKSLVLSTSDDNK